MTLLRILKTLFKPLTQRKTGLKSKSIYSLFTRSQEHYLNLMFQSISFKTKCVSIKGKDSFWHLLGCKILLFAYTARLSFI